MSTNKKYQVFVSATYLDLQEERQALLHSLLNLNCIPVGMELFPRKDNDHWQQICRLIDESDYYLVLVGGRYGSLTPTGISFTHREYIYAQTKKKPIIALLHNNPLTLPADKQESTNEGKVRLRDFTKLLSSGLYQVWNRQADLLPSAESGLKKLITAYPSAGWSKGGEVGASANVSGGADTTILKKRILQLEQEKEDLLTASNVPVESLARGSDKIILHYTCNVYVKGNCVVTSAKSQLTWDEIFTSLAPALLTASSETSMRNALAQRVAESALEDVAATHPKAHAVRDVEVSLNSLNSIKVQLRALGLIKKVTKANSDTLLWQLTPQGDRQMTSMMAVTR